MNALSQMVRLLPRMVPLAAVTVAVVVAWSQFYGAVGSVVCTVSAALGTGECSPGAPPDPQALLDQLRAPGSTPGKQICAALAGSPIPVAGCETDSGDSQWQRVVLVVGESVTFEYSSNLAQQQPHWSITATRYDAVTTPPVAGLPNVTYRGGVDATKLDQRFAPDSFTDVVFNAPRAVGSKAWQREAGDLVYNVLVSARSVLKSDGSVRFSGTDGMPASFRLNNWVDGRRLDEFPLPEGYSRPLKIRFLSEEFGVRYTPRRNDGRPLENARVEDMFWFVFHRS
jgi:hypothetical protein